MVTFSTWDIFIILSYIVLIIIVGFRAAKKSKNSKEEYLLASRTLTLPIFVATLVSTWYGGVLGVGEFSYKFGISNWIVFGVPYYIFAIIFALFIAKKVRATNLVSIPDRLFQMYDMKTSLFGAFLTFILASPAPYILMLGILVQLIFQISLTTSIIISTILTTIYLISGGFRSDVYVNSVEFILMFVGFFVIIIFSYTRFGGFDFLSAKVPPLLFTWDGGNSFQYIVVWFFIASLTLVDPSFYQRCYAAKNSSTARNGILLSVLFWMVFDFMTCTIALYARAAIPNISNPIFTYPLFAEISLPSIAKGIFYVGMLATIMSSLSSFTFTSALAIGNDMIGRLLHTEDEEIRNNAIQVWTKIGIVVTSIIGIFFALWFPSVVELWYVIATAVVPGLLVPLLTTYFQKLKISTTFAFAAMVLGFFSSLCWLIGGFYNDGKYWFSIEPMYPGLFVSLIVWGIGKLKEKKSSISSL